VAGRFDRILRFFAKFGPRSAVCHRAHQCAGAQHAEITRLLTPPGGSFGHPVIRPSGQRTSGAPRPRPALCQKRDDRRGRGQRFHFNAWGGKFSPWNLDDAIPRRIAQSLNLRSIRGDIILEGGAIEIQ